MSRTFKDIPHRLNTEFVKVVIPYRRIEYFYDDETDSIKSREDTDYEFTIYEKIHYGKLPHWYHGMPTPAWWTRIMLNRPLRRATRVWERKVLLHDLEETNPPALKQPKLYYW